jgi:phosphoserine phosphatase RsbU/P
MTDYNNRVLIIDDDSGIRDSIKNILSPPPLPDILSTGASLFEEQINDVEPVPDSREYDLAFVKSGEEGIEFVEKAQEEKIFFAAAFIDMRMPGLDGAETSKRILLIDPKIKIVIITASPESKASEIVRVTGREDLFYLRKPFNPEEIKQFARALTNQWNLEREKEELTLKLNNANQQLIKYAEDLNNTNLELKTTNEELAATREHEINIAARIQETLLLGKLPRNLKGIQVEHLTIASQKVDGDFYEFYRLRDQSLDILVGDVMGKGVPSALVGAAVKRHFLHTLNEHLLSGGNTKIPEPEDIVSSTHDSMIEELEELETFVTLCYARFDLARFRCIFVDCGHMRTIHFHHDSCICNLLQGVNMPLGFPEIEPFKQISVPFKPGDLFFFYSDGLTEARNPQGNMYGEERLVDFIQKNAGINTRNLIDGIIKDVVSFSKSDTFDDDFTCVAVKIDQTSIDSDFSAEARFDFESDLNQLESVRSFVQKFCENIPDSLLDHNRNEQIILAVNEAAANIIKHAYQGRSEEKIQITAEVSADRLAVRLYDWGKDFDPESVQDPKFDGSQEGGFGIYIIAQSVDEVNYFRDADGRNCIELIINLAGGK